LYLLGLVEQSLAYEKAGPESWKVRERGMAANVLALLEMHEARGGVIAWGHNGHLEAGQGALPSVGGILRKRLREKYLIVGTAIGEGSIQAVDPRRFAGMRAVALPAMSNFDVTAFLRGSEESCLLDLRSSSSPVVAEWMREPHETREVGYAMAVGEDIAAPRIPRERFDILVFFPKSSRARPLRDGGGPPR
jgi:erythromycin esterase-like protein